MGSLNLVTTIVDRKVINRYMEVYQACDLHVAFLALGYGTASNEILDYLGLESNQKAVAFSVMEESSWLKVKKQMEKQEYQKEEESTLKNTNHQLIIVITEPGYTNMVMDAARSAGAYGGTVIHAKGTGMEMAEKFMGVSLASEKELVLIVAKTEQKNGIMQAIMKDAGLRLVED